MGPQVPFMPFLFSRVAVDTGYVIYVCMLDMTFR